MKSLLRTAARAVGRRELWWGDVARGGRRRGSRRGGNQRSRGDLGRRWHERSRGNQRSCGNQRSRGKKRRGPERQGAAGTGCRGAGTAGRDGGVADRPPDAAANPCQEVVALDRSCKTDAIVSPSRTTTNCCGTEVWIGINAAVKPQYSTLEAPATAAIPCAAARPSRLRPTTARHQLRNHGGHHLPGGHLQDVRGGLRPTVRDGPELRQVHRQRRREEHRACSSCTSQRLHRAHAHDVHAVRADGRLHVAGRMCSAF
jgi:hypothetical protein